MTIEQLKAAQWKQKKKVAELSVDGMIILTMELGAKKAKVSFEKRQLEIKREGFWHPQVVISESSKVLLTQNHIGFWGSKNEVQIGETVYEGRSKTNTLYNVGYFAPSGEQILGYRLSAVKWKAAVNFTIDAHTAPTEDVLFLFILGYYTVKNVVQESGAPTAVMTTGV